MMEGINEVLVVIGMFALRLGLPIGITVVIGYLLRRLDSRWEAEAKALPERARQLRAATAGRPCWEEKGCSELDMARCPACENPDIPCWLARLRAERRLPAGCLECNRYSQRLETQPEPQPAPQTVRT